MYKVHGIAGREIHFKVELLLNDHTFSRDALPLGETCLGVSPVLLHR